MAIKVIKESAPPPGSLGKAELYALAVGQVIGAGVITLIVPAIKMTGYSAWLAYFFAIIMGFLIIAPALFVTSTLRLGGGYYSVLCDLAGPKLAGIFSFAFLTQCLSLSLFGVAAAEYLGDIIPFLSTPLAKTLVGASLLTFFFLVNLMGVDIMAGAQKLMTWLLIAALTMFAIMGIFNLKLPIFDFKDENFMPFGMINFTETGMLGNGFLPAILLFVYSCQGYVMTMAYGRDSKNARRDIPFAMMATVPTLLVLYVGVAMAGTGAIAISEYGESTSLVYAARSILPAPLFYFFIIGGPIMALLSTLNSSFAYNALTISQSCRDGWLPKKFGEQNSRGAYKYILTFMFILGLVPILLRFQVTTITNQIQLVGSVLNFMYLFAYIRMPSKYPEAWKKARLHIPNALFYVIVGISFLLNIVVFWKSTLSIDTTIVIVSVGALVVCAAAGLFRAKNGDITIHTSVWADDGNGEASAEGSASK